MLEIVHDVEILGYRHIEVKGRLLRQKADAALCLDGIFEDVYAVYLCRSRGGGKISCENVHRGALTCTVGTQETDYLACTDVERNVVYGVKVAVFFYYSR